MITRLADFWNRLSLAQRFALAGGPVLLAGMAVLGFWVSNRIAEGAVRNTATLTVLYLDGIIAPVNDELSRDGPPAPVALHALDETFRRPEIQSRIAAFRIWRPDGTLVYATDSDREGEKFPVSPDFALVTEGQVISEYRPHAEPGESLPSPDASDLIEIYAPIREVWSGRVIAVAEVYQRSDELLAELRDARINTWLVVAASALAMAAALFRIVLSGSRTIREQSDKLQSRLETVQSMAEQNLDLRLRVQSAAGRASTLNERYLRRISADLHDGPAQHLAVASLRLNRVGTLEDGTARKAEIAEIRSMLDTAMTEIRGISRGLVLPELEGLNLQELVEKACTAHENRSNTTVTLQTSGLDAIRLDHPRSICVYRFVQEGLNNAFKHGQAIDQAVGAHLQAGQLTVTVSDHGPVEAVPAGQEGLGLTGLRERVETLGGTFAIAANRPTGTCITMTLGLDSE